MIKALKNIELKDYSTMGIGGLANALYVIEEKDQILSTFQMLKRSGESFKVIGGCSNLIIPDDVKIRNLVQLKIMGIDKTEADSAIKLSVGAGELLDDLVEFTVKESLSGIECLSGIPGWVGAMAVQNVGAYGVETSDVLESVSVFDTRTEEFLELKANECDFSYRKSRFNSYDKDRFWILSLKFEMSKLKEQKVNYPDLLKVFPSGICKDSALLRKSVLEIRAKKGMLSGKDFPKSAGSFFKNPVLDIGAYEELKLKLGTDFPVFKMGKSHVKVPAAWLIGQTMYKKGFRRGSFGVSDKHNLSLVNIGDGSFEELMSFADDIKNAVFKISGLELEIEPEILK